ncbi:MAG: fluoride efflux transporter FluC [Solirubrobacteraceae bacterium]
MTALYVAIGGAVGALARYGLGTTVSDDALPWVTVAINVAGSLLLGFLVSVADWFSPEVRAGLAVGLLGGFTTFSTFSVDVFLDLEAGKGLEAAGYVVASTALGVGAAAAGYYAGRAVAGS